MSLIKRVAAGMLAVFIIASFASCGSNTKIALTIDNQEIPAGVYIYFLNIAQGDLQTEAEKVEYDGDIWDFTFEDKSAEQWIKDKAVEYCLELVAEEKEYAKRQISLTDDEKKNMDSYLEYYWGNYSKSMEEKGIAQSSFTRAQYKSVYETKILESIFGKGGEQEISEDELKNYMGEKYSRVNHILISSKDESGNNFAEDSEEYKNAEAKAQELLKKAKETKTEDEFLALIKENSADYNEDTKDDDLKLGMITTLENSGYVQEFEDEVKKLKVGEYGLVKSTYGWHIIKRYDMWSDGLVKLDDYRTSLITAMKGEDYDKMVSGWVEELRPSLVLNNAAIERYKPKKLFNDK